MDGYEVARQIRSARALSPGGLLIALTGWGRAEDKRRTEQAGFDMHLTKPVEPGMIRSILRPASVSNPTRDGGVEPGQSPTRG